MAAKKNKSAIDLSDLNRADLLQLQKDIEKQLKKLEKDQRKAALEAAEKIAKEHGFSLGELTGTTAKATKTQSPAKYRNPANPDQTWTGRGRRPAWLKNVDDLSSYEI